MFLALQILDLVPILAHQYFLEKLPVTLHGAHVAVLFCMGLQDRYWRCEGWLMFNLMQV
jgi:hypothetical protein